MRRLLIDENFNEPLLLALLSILPDLDVVRAREVGLGRATDRQLLLWAEDHGRIVLTHDLRTMPEHAAAHLSTGRALPGVIIVNQHRPAKTILSELQLVMQCALPEDLQDQVLILPL